MSPTKTYAPRHPATFPRYLLDQLVLHLGPERRAVGRPLEVLDPFAGVGRIHDLPKRLAKTTGVELEPEWAGLRAGTVQGDATNLPAAWSARFDAIVTSPCLWQGHRLLTADLRWVAAGDLREGDQLLGFDEHGTAGATGVNSRRRWQRSEVLRSTPREVECVRVILANGDEIITTPEHPWLAQRYAYSGTGLEWVQSKDLMGAASQGTTKGHRRGARQPYYVQLQVEPWVERRSYDAGWLAGMFDGEGSLSLGVHGSPKMSLCQVQGPVVDCAEELMERFGYAPNRITRKGGPEHRQVVDNLYVTGGFPGMMRALGELRPRRLLAKWDALDIATRTVQADKVAVLAVELAGHRDIQEIETTTGTYIGEGYLHHNCYGNRMADSHEAKDSCAECNGTGTRWTKAGCADAPFLCRDCHSVACACGGFAKAMRGHNHGCPTCSQRLCKTCNGSGLSKRYTYRHALGRPLSERNAGAMHWGEPYRALHAEAWAEAHRVTRVGGLIIVNVKNHVRSVNGQKVEQYVVEWHAQELARQGFKINSVVGVSAAGMRHGANADARVPQEKLILGRAR